MDDIISDQNTLLAQLLTIRRNYDKTSVARRTLGYVTGKIEAVTEIWKTFQSNDIELRKYKEYIDSVYVKENTYDKCDQDYGFLKGDFNDRLIELNTPAANDNPIPNIPNIHVPNIPQPPAIRLPQINVPTFSGDYASWTAFHDMFVSLIHSNTTLSNVQKLHYLKSNLRDKAADFLRHTPITNDNYITAWNDLQQRYANKKILVETQLKLLFNQPTFQKDSAVSIRHLIDTTKESIAALRVLEIDVSTWDPILIHILVQKLSKDSHVAWELNQEGAAELASYDDFITFLENRFRMLESLADRTPTTSNLNHQSRNIKSHAGTSSSSNINACPICSNQHYIRDCPTFLQLNVVDRPNLLKQHRICFNCLIPGHLIPACKNRMNCQICKKRHHTLLHDAIRSQSFANSPSSAQQPHPSRSTSNAQGSSSAQEQPSSNNNFSIASHIASSSLTNLSSSPANVLLATAIVTGVSSTGQLIPLRALIDQGSQITLLTENAAQLLRLKSQPINYPLSGIGNTSAGYLRKLVRFQIRSPIQTHFTLNLNAFVIKSVTGILPPVRCATSSWPHTSNLQLADPSFNLPGTIDLLIGADAYPDIIQDGLLRGPSGAPIAQSTVFGWILSGYVPSSNHNLTSLHSNIHTLHTCVDIDSRLQQFWEIENKPTSKPMLTEEENLCEEHYNANTKQSSDGRYIVRLPIRDNSELGESRETAHKRLIQLERRLKLNPSLRESYINFMREYLSLGHMKLSETNYSPHHPKYFIPHHAVIKENSSTTKVRVVFDASSKSANGVSLNELMLIGPKIQDDLSVILLRWRRFPIAFTADVEKMYRQIRVHPDDHRFQHILWRESSNDTISEYALQTVTYGTSCAPHLAVRTLHQLAIDQSNTFPVASNIARHDFYVDDLMSGAYSASDALLIRREICALMSAGGLRLRKWVSNYSPLLDEIDINDREIQHPLNIKFNDTVTALGIIWNPATDMFHFKLTLPDINQTFSKRNVLSDISRLFDPLGWLAPLIVRSKMLMQQLWLQGISWDESLPDSISNQWVILRSDLGNVSKITIPRWIYYHDNEIELHGFSDASQHAYAAAIYARTKQPDGCYITTLLTAKTRVAPLKQLSIPKLELCGAVLVAELLQITKINLSIEDSKLFAWTDSSIVLHWLHSQPSRWKTFIANRVSTIQQIVPLSCWRHVPTADNPADCATRGLDAVTLQKFDLWWHGPTWLNQSSDTWPILKLKPHQDDVIEHERIATSHLTTASISTPSFAMQFLESFSSLDRLLRVFAYCNRFINILRKRIQPNHPISATEKQLALNFFILSSQRCAFHEEIKNVSKRSSVSCKSKLISLYPILDSNGILRVGGRLENSQMNYEEKHPIILPTHCHLTTLIIRQQHFATMHGGAQLISALIRKRFWIINARNAIRLHIHRCITCHRFKAASASQIMGNLPQPRVNITRAFTHTGVDYAGPIDLRMSKGRGNKSYKGYISLFICLCTKAIHIEAVSDLTSAGFIAAYRRFVARRGLPSNIYSDNGTNFVGAAKTLRKQQTDSLLQIKDDIIETATKSNTDWHFIPPSSPHFGGLWEAGVKSLKFHLKRSIGNSKLTYEELSTLLAQIEACLNSRPLTPLSSDPTDLSVLTPGHFLTGDALLALPDKSNDPRPISVVTRWQLVQRLYQNVTTRWQSEYLSRLQQRPKWTKPSPNVQINDLVLLKDSSHPPPSWPLARVIKVHPGDDGFIRVVTVRTSTSEFKRCITKICPLPN